MATTVIYANMVIVHDPGDDTYEVIPMQTAKRMRWAGDFAEGYWIRVYTEYDGITQTYIGDIDDDNYPTPFESEDDANIYLLSMEAEA